jgi:hypothetical protein
MSIKHTSIHNDIQDAMRESERRRKQIEDRKNQPVVTNLIDLSKNIVTGWDQLTDEQRATLYEQINLYIELNKNKK